jgi:small subunit ribosomal protein S15
MAACVSESLLVADPHHGQSGQPDDNGAAGPPKAGGTKPQGLQMIAPSTTSTMSQPVKSEVIAQYKTHEKDTGSSDVQIALLTARINHLTEHLRTHRKDFHSRRGLLQMASRRRKLLDYIKSEDLAKYNDLLQKLSLRK